MMDEVHIGFPIGTPANSILYANEDDAGLCFEMSG